MILLLVLILIAPFVWLGWYLSPQKQLEDFKKECRQAEIKHQKEIYSNPEKYGTMQERIAAARSRRPYQ